MESKKISTRSHHKGLQPLGWSPLGPEAFLNLSSKYPILDVRTLKEYCQGHIPGAISFPLFSDEERAVVGTTYARNGKNAALLKGLEIVGPKLNQFVREAQGIATNGELLVHCWRGGMRSEAMAWLTSFAGIKTTVLEGGYKAYRRYIRESFHEGPPVIVLGGMTGSGKTELLRHLDCNGDQVLDLEALAHHKGSAFGALGQPEQPTNEQFENNLAARWLCFDQEKPAWIEDESRNIGKVIIPEPLFVKMINARLVFIDVPFEERVNRLMLEYGNFNANDLAFLIEKIGRRMGGDLANTAIDALDAGDLERTVSIVLKYYDKTYQYGFSKRDKTTVSEISFAAFRKGFAEFR